MSTVHFTPHYPRALWRWRSWLPHFVVDKTDDPPAHREAWWGPVNVRLMRVGTVLWPTHFRRTLIVEVNVFGFRFVLMLWRKK